MKTKYIINYEKIHFLHLLKKYGLAIFETPTKNTWKKRKITLPHLRNNPFNLYIYPYISCAYQFNFFRVVFHNFSVFKF